MPRRHVSVLAVVGLAFVLGCASEERPSLLVGTDHVTVINRTDTRWVDVEVWLNDHYRAQAPELLPGQRLDAPYRLFVAGFGQRFDPSRQVPFGISVDAKTADGRPVHLVWGRGRRR